MLLSSPTVSLSFRGKICFSLISELRTFPQMAAARRISLPLTNSKKSMPSFNEFFEFCLELNKYKIYKKIIAILARKKGI